MSIYNIYWHMIKLLNILNEMEIGDPDTGTGLTVERQNNNFFSVYLNDEHIGNATYYTKNNSLIVYSNNEPKVLQFFEKHNIPYKHITIGAIEVSPDVIDNWWHEKDSLNEMEIADPGTGLTVEKSKHSDMFDLYLNGTFIESADYDNDTNNPYGKSVLMILFPNRSLHVSRYLMIKDYLDQYDIPHKEDSISYARDKYIVLAISTDVIDNWDEYRDILNEMEIEEPHNRIPVKKIQFQAYKYFIPYSFNIEDLIPEMSYKNHVDSQLHFSSDKNMEWTCYINIFPSNGKYFQYDEKDIIRDWIGSYGYEYILNKSKVFTNKIAEIYIYIPMKDAFDMFDVDPKEFKND